jgi:hypothetical protein
VLVGTQAEEISLVSRSEIENFEINLRAEIKKRP